MIVVRTLVVALAMVIGTWLSYDGGRAFVRGDYTTPSSGPHAGKLGPWATLLSAVRLDPRGTPAKALHVFLGALWCTGAVAFIFRSSIAISILMICAIGSLWYLPFGTFISVVEIGLLVWLRKKGAA